MPPGKQLGAELLAPGTVAAADDWLVLQILVEPLLSRLLNLVSALVQLRLRSCSGLRAREAAQTPIFAVTTEWAAIVPRGKRTVRPADHRIVALDEHVALPLKWLVEQLRAGGHHLAPLGVAWVGMELIKADLGTLLELVDAPMDLVGGLRLDSRKDLLRHEWFNDVNRHQENAVLAAGGDLTAKRVMDAISGHGQQGGFSASLPTRLHTWAHCPRHARSSPGALARRLHGEDLKLPECGPVVPFSLKASVPPGRDWLPGFLGDPSIPLDDLPAIHARLWKLNWGRGLTTVDKLRVLLAVQLAGYGELLVRDPESALRRLEWRAIVLDRDPPILAVSPSDVQGHILSCLGPLDTLLLRRLSCLLPPEQQPFEGFDWKLVSAVLTEVAGRPRSLVEVMTANRAVHLLTHTMRELGYLMGVAGHKVEASVYPPGLEASHARAEPQEIRYGGLSGLARELRRGGTPLNGEGLRALAASLTSEQECGERERRVLEALVTYCQTRFGPRRGATRAKETKAARSLASMLRELIIAYDLLIELFAAEDAELEAAILARPRPEVAELALRMLSRVGLGRAGLIAKNVRRLSAHVVVNVPDRRPTVDDLFTACEQFGDGALLATLYLVLAFVTRRSEHRGALLRHLTLTPDEVILEVRGKGGHDVEARVALPDHLAEAVMKIAALLETMDPDQPLLSQLRMEIARRLGLKRLDVESRIGRALLERGHEWTIHDNRSIALMAGLDRSDLALLSLRLNHRLLRTDDESYLCLDPREMAPSAAAIRKRYEDGLGVAAVQLLAGVSRATAERRHAPTPEALVATTLRRGKALISR